MAGSDTTAEVVPYGNKPLALSKPDKERSQWVEAARRFSRNRLAMFGLFMLILLILVAVFADVLAPYGLNDADFSIARELPFLDPAHPLGADSIGRDYMSRLIYGARTSMVVGLVVPLISFSIGLPLGALAGYRGGLIDWVVQRLVEIGTAIPRILLAILLLSVVGSGVPQVIFVLGVTAWIDPTRLTRAQFFTFRERDFVTAARAIGVSDVRIAVGHILPNALAPLLVAFSFAVPLAIFSEAALSFLGLGITDPTASWGQMVGTSRGTTIQVYYHLALFPTLLVALTMLAFSFVGDGLQEALDPARIR